MALPELYEQITWHNGTTPAINEDNLNAMSQALKDIDDRVIEIASTVMEDVPVIEEALEALDPPIRVVKDFAGVQALTDALDKNAVDVKVKVTPKQDLHGYSKPWAGGGGNNKLQNTASTTTDSGVTLTVNSDGTVSCANTSNNTIYFKIFEVTSSSTYNSMFGALIGNSVKLVGCPSGGAAAKYEMHVEMNGSTITGSQDYGSGATFTMPSFNTRFSVYAIIRSGQNMSGKVFKPMLGLASLTNFDYAHFEPYTNICPITGFTEAKVTRTGKNICMSPQTFPSTISGIKWTKNADGSYHAKGTATAQSRLYFTPNGQTQSAWSNAYYNLGTPLVISNYGSSKITLWCDAPGVGNITAGNSKTAAANSSFGNFFAYVANGTTVDDDFYPMVCPKAIAGGGYAKYESETFTISLGDTRYLAELDVTTGVLTVTGGYIASYAGETLPGAWISDRDAYTEGGTPTTGAQVVYELATPVTVQLTATEVALLYAYDTLWADTGDLALTYDASGVLRIANGKLDIDTFKSIVASSSDFADFKSKVAAL